MPRDPERVDRLQTSLREAGLDGIVCTMPENVLLLTGYFPIVGTSVAVMNRDGQVTLLAPEDEMGLADCDGADQVIAFQPVSLEKLTNAEEAIQKPLARALREEHLENARLGYENGPAYEPASYVSMHLYGEALATLVNGATLRPAADLLARMKSVLTTIELDRLRRACRIARCAFEEGAGALCPGRKETAVAASFRMALSVAGVGFEGVSRAGGEVSCMSGVNSAKAFGAYARSRAKELEIEDFALVHCNSYADGYWTDITRTYCVRMAGGRQLEMYGLILEAFAAAFDAVRPGVQAAEVDRAARAVFEARGYGDAFKHCAGHGVGYAAINHDALPRLHPKSPDVLETGMAFNIEPALYFEGFGGARHCQIVAVTENGAELLTPFHCTLKELIR